jgi:iron complex outermembrane receptor protein
MKIILALLLMLPFVVPAQVNHASPEPVQRAGAVLISVYGRVTESVSGMPLAGANIYFADARIGTTTDKDGRYIIRNIALGHHLLEVSHIGYNTIVEHIDLARETEKDFVLSPAVVENLGVTVTGVSNATNIRKIPIPVTLVRKSQLLQTPSTNIIDALTRVPGVSQVSTGPAISKPVIRGLGYNRVVVVNDGIRQEGQQWGDEHGIEIDELSVDRVEILKGPASLAYGSDALAGVINFITNVPVAEGMIRGNVITGYQTNNNQSAFNANIAGNNKGFNWNLYGSLKGAKDYRNRYDGRVLNSRFHEENFGGYVGINKSWGFSHLIFSSYNQHAGIVEGEREDASGRFLVFAETPLERIAQNADLQSKELLHPFQHIRHRRLISDNSFSLGLSRIKLNLGYQQNLRKEYGDPETPGVAGLFFDLGTFNYNAQVILPDRNEWHTSLGVSGMIQENKNRGEEVIIPAYDLFDAGGFVFTQKSFEKWTMTGGLRYDRRTVDSRELMEGAEVKFASFTRQFSNFSGSLGATYQPAPFLTLKGNVARGFRAPSLPELGSNGAHEGTNRYEYGRRELHSEKSLQFDGGVEVDYDHLTFSFSAFYNNINDFIFYSRLTNASGDDSIVNVDGEDLQAFQYDQHNARLSGWEVMVDFHPHPLDWLHFENNLSFVRGRFDEPVGGSENLPMIPAPRWISEVRANFPKGGNAFKNVYFRFETDHNFRQDRPFFGYGTETSTPGYTLLNAGVGADIISGGQTLFSVHLAGSNLANKAYQHHLNRLKYADTNMLTGRQGIFNMGRNFSIKISVPLVFKNVVKETVQN